MLPLLLVQICVIAFAAQLLGWIFQKIGQPKVAGEMTGARVGTIATVATAFGDVVAWLMLAARFLW